MKRRVVVPVNGTHKSEQAVAVAVAFARRLHASIALVSVITWPYTEHPAHPGYHEGLAAPYPDLEVESVVVRTRTEASNAILAVSKPGDIICLGADHSTTTGEIVLRSVFLDLVRAFHGPVIAVGPQAVLPVDATEVLVCFDGTEHAEQGMELVSQVIEPAGYIPFLVQVTNAPQGEVPETSYLRKLALDHPALGIKGWDVLHGHPLAAISGYAKGPEIAAIAFATDAGDPLSRLISPSLANELIDVATRPLILIGPKLDMSVTQHLIQPGQAGSNDPS